MPEIMDLCAVFSKDSPGVMRFVGKDVVSILTADLVTFGDVFRIQQEANTYINRNYTLYFFSNIPILYFIFYTQWFVVFFFCEVDILLLAIWELPYSRDRYESVHGTRDIFFQHGARV